MKKTNIIRKKHTIYWQTTFLQPNKQKNADDKV